MTNIEEISDSSPYKYNRLRFVEFLELIGRIAEYQFRGSDIQGIDLGQKIQFILNEILKGGGAQKATQGKALVESSSSDDDTEPDDGRS